MRPRACERRHLTTAKRRHKRAGKAPVHCVRWEAHRVWAALHGNIVALSSSLVQHANVVDARPPRIIVP